jgi:hypothetical protein
MEMVFKHMGITQFIYKGKKIIVYGMLTTLDLPMPWMSFLNNKLMRLIH